MINHTMIKYREELVCGLYYEEYQLHGKRLTREFCYEMSQYVTGAFDVPFIEDISAFRAIDLEKTNFMWFCWGVFTANCDEPLSFCREYKRIKDKKLIKTINKILEELDSDLII